MAEKISQIAKLQAKVITLKWKLRKTQKFYRSQMATMLSMHQSHTTLIEHYMESAKKQTPLDIDLDSSEDEMEFDEVDRRLTTTPIDDDSRSSFNEIDRKIMNGEITDEETRSGFD